MVQLAEEGKRNWLKTSEVKNGEKIKILDEGAWVESTKFTYDDGNPVKQFVVSIERGGSAYAINMNKVSRTQLSTAWGTDTSKWVGHMVQVEKIKVMVGGDLKESLLLSPAMDNEEVGEYTPTVEEENEMPF